MKGGLSAGVGIVRHDISPPLREKLAKTIFFFSEENASLADQHARVHLLLHLSPQAGN